MGHCPKCGIDDPGRYCPECGTELVAAAIEREAAKVDAHEAEHISDAAINARSGGKITLEYDKLCPLFENMNGTLRFRFEAGRETLENVKFRFANCDSSRQPEKEVRRLSGKIEFPVQFPPQAVGLQSWRVSLEYYSARRKHRLAGDFQVLVRAVESRKNATGNISINIATNIGNVGNASDVSVNQRGAEDISKYIVAIDPYEEMRRISESNERKWTGITLLDDNMVADLPPMPPNAPAEAITLEFGHRKFRFVAKPTIKLGRKRDANDIVIHPQSQESEEQLAPYRRISREHCFFEHSGESVKIFDGKRDVLGNRIQSTYGTYFNGAKIEESATVPATACATIALGDLREMGGVPLTVSACSPAEACRTCPHANTRWCGGGKRPALLVRRLDGVAESFIGLWSCFCMGEAEALLADVVVFRKDGAFAYRRSDGKTGWLVPGVALATEFGTINVK